MRRNRSAQRDPPVRSCISAAASSVPGDPHISSPVGTALQPLDRRDVRCERAGQVRGTDVLRIAQRSDGAARAEIERVGRGGSAVIGIARVHRHERKTRRNLARGYGIINRWLATGADQIF